MASSGDGKAPPNGNASDGKIRIKVESETDAEMQVRVKETDMVKDLHAIVNKHWNDGTDYLVLYYESQRLQNDKPLSEYNIKNGSVVQVKVFVDDPDDESP